MDNSAAAVRADLEAAGVAVVDCRLRANKCLSLADGALVAVDRSKFKTQQEEATALMHEEGHFESGAFYVPFSPYQVKAQAEYRADKAAALKHIPPSELEAALHRGLCVWEIAELFNVTPAFVLRAYTIYQDHMGINFATLA